MKVFIKTYGCSMNQSDSETMAAILQNDGYELVNSIEESETVIFNTCTVKDPTQSKFFDELEKTKKIKKVVVAGCIAQAQPELFTDENLIGVEQLQKISAAVGGVNVQFIDRSTEPRVDLPSIRKNPVIEIIPINKGCASKCTYCKTKDARGNLASFPLRSIVSRANNAINEGVKEVWLTSQDTGAYGLDIGISMPELVQKVADNAGDFMIRIGMTNPQFVVMYEREIIELFKNPKIYRFLHVPVQSASNNVLKKMIRPYNIDLVTQSLLRIKQAIPDITLATDIICGFPTETEEDWDKTMQFVQLLDFPIINISKFYCRPGTKAATMKQLSSKIIKSRSAQLTEWFINKPRKEYSGMTLEVLVNEINNLGQHIGKTKNYLQVIVDSEVPLGSSVLVKITKTTPFHLFGKLL